MLKVYAILNRHIKETGAELVINFYELLTGLTYFFFRPAVPQICYRSSVPVPSQPIQITQKANTVCFS